MLDILELFLDLEQYAYLRLDGQTPVEERCVVAHCVCGVEGWRGVVCMFVCVCCVFVCMFLFTISLPIPSLSPLSLSLSLSLSLFLSLRQSLIDEFTENPAIFIFLLSTKVVRVDVERERERER